VTAIPAKGGYTPPRGPDGRIIIGPIVDDEPAQDAAPEVSPERPSVPPAPVRRIVRSDGPTSFEALRPGAASVPPAASWRVWVAGLGALVLIAFGVWVVFTPAAPAVVTEGTEAPAAAVVVEGVTQGTERLPFAVVAFAEPEGAPIGALEPGRAYTVVAEQGQWAHLDVAGSGAVWVRTWELHGQPRPLPTLAPVVPTRAPAPAAPAPAFVAPPASTCVPVLDGDFGGLLGQACGATSEERQQRALELLQAVDSSR
jgi:hypothetical protein